MKQWFDFYDLTIEVTSTTADLVEEVRRHFAYFSIPPRDGQVRIEMRRVPPPYAELSPLPASVITPRNVCFQNGKVTYVDYFGQGLAVFDRKEKHCVIYGMDHDLIHEIAYLFILSTVGQYLDNRRLHRVHALGVSYDQKGHPSPSPLRRGKKHHGARAHASTGILAFG